MQAPPQMTDPVALTRNRSRSRVLDPRANFLHREAANEINQRLELVNRTFTSVAVITGHPEHWDGLVPGARLVQDAETLDLEPSSLDLIIHAMSLHWANDPVGQLVQSRRALRPDGLFLGIMLGGQTLTELRHALTTAEAKVADGLSPRIAPMGEIRDLGALVQRAGFALPVADAFSLAAQYPSALHLMRDLRAMGESNALMARSRRPMRRAILDATVDEYAHTFGRDGTIPATFEFIVLTGWAPSDDQPKPLRPGTATMRLADALDSQEQSLPDPAKPGRI